MWLYVQWVCLCLRVKYVEEALAKRKGIEKQASIEDKYVSMLLLAFHPLCQVLSTALLVSIYIARYISTHRILAFK